MSNEADLQAVLVGKDFAWKLLAKRFGVTISAGRAALVISGESTQVAQAEPVARRLLKAIMAGEEFAPGWLERWLANRDRALSEAHKSEYGTIVVNYRGQAIRPRTEGQAVYMAAMAANDLVFAVGPAGTGKTFLAICQAVAAFKRREVDRLVLTRPAVEAGEKLGFLPGDLAEKLDPYLRPVYDALYDTLGIERTAKLRELGQVEVAPLAYMRGRTLNNAFVVLDEAQNTTPAQMKMFLTRLGTGSKAVVTGDLTQVDLDSDTESGMVDAMRALRNVQGLGFVELAGADIVRHRLVGDIVAAYQVWEAEGSPRESLDD